jgi:hypothetical protein
MPALVISCWPGIRSGRAAAPDSTLRASLDPALAFAACHDQRIDQGPVLRPFIICHAGNDAPGTKREHQQAAQNRPGPSPEFQKQALSQTADAATPVTRFSGEALFELSLYD